MGDLVTGIVITLIGVAILYFSLRYVQTGGDFARAPRNEEARDE